MKKLLFLPLIFSLLSCGELDKEFASDILSSLRTGWRFEDENLSQIPQDISSFSGDISSLPSLVSLENIYPPIKSQGQYGTCVAWSVGYSMKTALNGIEKNWSSSDLAKEANQTSPKDLWFTLPSSRNSNCEGTSFETAFDALIAKGAKTLASAPYSNMGNCSGTSDGNPNNKLANYRKIAYNQRLTGGTKNDGMTLENFKGYLAQGRPVAIGARLGDRFMRWNSGATISSDTYNDPGMQHAYHAMVLSGYDDSKQAFKVRNSWGTNWGNNGSIWVDYDFFLNDFCFAAFVAQNPNAPPPSEDKDLSSGYDLLASLAGDIQDPDDPNPRSRGFYYEVYNNGSKPITASQRWSVLYMYYNAYDAEDSKIIFEDYYTDEYGKLGSDGNLAPSQTQAIAGGYWNHANVQPGKMAGEAEWGTGGFYLAYEMPEITGDYYLVVLADAYDVIDETDEDNNFFFITAEKGKPLKFNNGVMQSKPANIASTNNTLAKKVGRTAPATSVPELGELNAYTPQEIKTLVLRSKKSGALAKKIIEHREKKQAIKKRRKL